MDNLKKSKRSKKDTHRLLGPEVTSGVTLAEAINAGANYFKHHEENLNSYTEEIFEKLGIKIDNPETEHPILNLLEKISRAQPPIFAPLLTHISGWYETLAKIQ